MAFTKITAAGIGSTETVTLDGLSVINNGSFGGNLTVSGVLTYEDVTNVDSVGLITARNGIVVGSGITLSKDGDVFFTGVATGNGSGLTNLPAANITGTLPAISGANLTNLTAGNLTGALPAISGANLTGLAAGGAFIKGVVGVTTLTPVGINTSTVDDKDLTGIGNSFKGLYIGNGMVIHDSELTGVHYIGTSFRGMMAGPVSIAGTLTVDGNYVVV